MKRFVITLLIVAAAALVVISMMTGDGLRNGNGTTGNGSPGNGNAITPADPADTAAAPPAEAADPATAQSPSTGPGAAEQPPEQDNTADANDATAGQDDGQNEQSTGQPDAPALWQELNVAPTTTEDKPRLEVLGSTDPDSECMMQAEISRYGASVFRIQLSQYKAEVGSDEPLTILNPYPELKEGEPEKDWLGAFAGERLTVKPAGALTEKTTEITDLDKVQWDFDGDRGDGVGKYWIEIVNEVGRPILRITRTYTLAKGVEGYDLHCDQQIENLTNAPLEVTFSQRGQVDLEASKDTYLGDRRMYIVGYHDTTGDPDLIRVYGDDPITRLQLLDKAATSSAATAERLLWNPITRPANQKLVWIAAANRYFTMAVHRPAPIAPPPGQDRVIPDRLGDLFPNVGLNFIGEKLDKRDDRRRAYVTLTTEAMTIPPGEPRNLDLALYAGPRHREVLNTPPFVWFDFATDLVIYSAGCTICLSQDLANGLIWFLRLIHALLADWGIAIIILVLCVRALLHPITKRAQISMMRMGKQMQAIQPEIEKLKKKYPDNPQKVQQEQMRLFREKGINPANMLGCLPMFLQMPIWIALFAMLSSAIELRHESAFWGVFQKISAGHWPFLQDLSAQDNFIPLAKWGLDFHLVPQWLWAGAPHITAFNLLPLLMVAVFVINQKLTTPPATTDQAKQQQKMMKIMSAIFPIFLYKAPCGLTLYILASTFAGIVDSTIVRRHIKREEEAGTLLKTKDPAKRRGCMGGKLAEALEARQRAMTEAQHKAGAKGKPGGGSYKRRKRK